MKLYLSGHMTGLPDLNYPTFKLYAGALRDLNFEVYDPSEWGTKYNDGVFQQNFAFADYCAYIAREADAVVVLPGWQNSLGARAEVALARALDKDVWDAQKIVEDQKFVTVVWAYPLREPQDL